MTISRRIFLGNEFLFTNDSKAVRKRGAFIGALLQYLPVSETQRKRLQFCKTVDKENQYF